MIGAQTSQEQQDKILGCIATGKQRRRRAFNRWW